MPTALHTSPLPSFRGWTRASMPWLLTVALAVHAATLPAAAPSFALLAEQITRQGGVVHGHLADGLDARGLRGLFARGDIDAGEPLLALAPGSFLGACSADADDHERGLKPFERLILALLREVKAGGASPHAIYLATLPEHVELLRDWSERELSWLQCERLVAAAVSQRKHHERTFHRLDGFLAPLYEDAAERRRAFSWAESIVRSRALGYDSEGQSHLWLLPIFDLCNHRSPTGGGSGGGSGGGGGGGGGKTPPALVYTEDGGIVFLAGSPLEAGDEVCITYCEDGNAALLLQYGFAELLGEEQQGYERLHVPVDTKEARGVVAAAVAAAGCEVEPVALDAPPLLLGSEELDAAAISELRCLLPEQCDEGALASTLLGLLACARDAYATSDADDVREMEVAAQCVQTREVEGGGGTEEEEEGSGTRWLMALTFRLGQKRQLCRTIRAVERMHEQGRGRARRPASPHGGEPRTGGALLAALRTT